MNPPLSFFRPRIARALALVTMALVATSMVACSLSRESVAKRTFLLEPTPPPMATVQKLTSLRLGLVNVAAPYRGKAFVYRQGELKYEADFYSEFFVSPAAMLSEATARALSAANVFRRTVPPGASDPADYVLDGFASELYGDMREPAKPVAAVAITYYLSPSNALSPNVVWTREYRQRAPAGAATPDAFAKALNVALSAILADLARDLAAAELAK